MNYPRSINDVTGRVSAIVYFREHTPGATLLYSREFVNDFVEAINGKPTYDWDVAWNRFFECAVHSGIRNAHFSWLENQVNKFNKTHHTHYRIRL